MSRSLNIAVLGAGGFVGSRLMELASVCPEWTFVPILRSAKSVARLSKLGLKPIFANTAEESALASSLSGFDAVVNLASGDWTSIQSDARIVYEASAKAGVRLLIHLSSAVVFGRVLSPSIHDDSSPQLNHWMLYARAKGAAEKFLRSRLEKSSMKVVVLRPGLIWGPRSNWSAMPAKDLSSGSAWLGGNGEGICNLCHVDNLARYIHQILRNPDPQCGFYNVADPGTLTWKSYYDAIAKGLGYSTTRIHLTTRGPRLLSPGALLDRLKQEPTFYRFMKKLLARLSSESKSLLKYHLPALAGGQYQPPVPGDVTQVGASIPRLTKELWSLHNTRHRLPTVKFAKDYGDPGLMPFQEALEVTLTWLRFAGFKA